MSSAMISDVVYHDQRCRQRWSAMQSATVVDGSFSVKSRSTHTSHTEYARVRFLKTGHWTQIRAHLVMTNWLGSVYQPLLHSHRHRFGAAAHIKLRQNAAHVLLSGRFADVETIGDLAVGQPLHQQG